MMSLIVTILYFLFCITAIPPLPHFTTRTFILFYFISSHHPSSHCMSSDGCILYFSNALTFSNSIFSHLISLHLFLSHPPLSSLSVSLTHSSLSLSLSLSWLSGALPTQSRGGPRFQRNPFRDESCSCRRWT